MLRTFGATVTRALLPGENSNPALAYKSQLPASSFPFMYVSVVGLLVVVTADSASADLVDGVEDVQSVGIRDGSPRTET